ncbi:hypothetical protein RUM43_014071 [Polyplax serrata]|uniref:Uncharacterized protein n=1 Tax=Polyplax serrata TaxID=468196 RepID=A0AAN8P1P9_POLSC
MSSFLHRFFWKNEKHIEKSNGEIAGELNNLENILLKVFKVIIWETPVFSALSLIFVNIVFCTDDEAFLPETSNEELELLRLAAELPCQNNQCDADSYDIFLECLSPCTNDSTDIPLLDNHCDTEGDSMEEDEFSMGLKMANEDYEKFNSNCLDNKLFSLENQFCSKHFKSNKFVNTDIESSSDTDSFEIISEKDM